MVLEQQEAQVLVDPLYLCHLKSLSNLLVGQFGMSIVDLAYFSLLCNRGRDNLFGTPPPLVPYPVSDKEGLPELYFSTNIDNSSIG